MSSPCRTATLVLPSRRSTACPRRSPHAATTPIRRIEPEATAPAPAVALPNSPALEATLLTDSGAAGARAAAGGASHTQVQYASTTPSSPSAAKFAADAVLFKRVHSQWDRC